MSENENYWAVNMNGLVGEYNGDAYDDYLLERRTTEGPLKDAMDGSCKLAKLGDILQEGDVAWERVEFEGDVEFS